MGSSGLLSGLLLVPLVVSTELGLRRLLSCSVNADGAALAKWLMTVGGVAATAVFNGAATAGFLTGVLQLNIQLSASTPSANALPVVIKVGSASSSATATLAVQ